MTDDTIRAALEASQKRASSFYSVGETAQIIAAFLRALPGAGPLPTGKWLAAAVEEAARHD